jgi:hypothetical protein
MSAMTGAVKVVTRERRIRGGHVAIRRRRLRALGKIAGTGVTARFS